MNSTLLPRLARTLLPLGLVPILCAPFAGAQVQHTVIATSGSTAPAGGNYAFFNTVTMNQRGMVTFDATLSGTSNSGVFLEDRSIASAIALGGNPAAGPFGFVGTPTINPRGDVVFRADTGIFLSRGTNIVPLARSGDAAAGGGTLTPDSFVVNSSNVIAYSATITGGGSTTGIFRSDGANAVAIASDNTPAPTGGTYSAFGGLAINRHRQVAFYTVMTGGSADFAIFRRDGYKTTPIFAANQSAPDGGTFGDFSDPVMNEDGQVATIGFALQNTTSTFGIFIGDGEKATAIALDGHAAPKGGNYARGTFSPNVLNDRGQLAFNVGLSGGTSSSGIFRADSGEIKTIALAGTTASGTTGTFAKFLNMKMLNDGRVAFVGQLTLGVGGVDRTNDTGIWVGSSDADLRLLVRTGNVIGGNVVGCLPNSPDQFDFTEQGVVWISRCPGRPNGSVVFSALAPSEPEHD